jgi:opacity protein-like surface antigen
MRKWITLLMTLLVGCGSYANANMGQVTLEAGYRRDTIDWKHRFPSNDPFVSSTQRFKDLDIFQIGVHGRSTLGCNFYVRGCAYWGWILDGDFERSFNTYFSPYDSYYFDENFKFGFSDERYSTIDDQYVFGIGAAIGYPFYFCDCTMVLAPVIGYAFDEQNVRVDDPGFNFGNEDSSDFLFACGGRRHHCCRQTFISRWYGPFVGVDFDWRPWNSCFNVWSELEYHWGDFRGKRSEFDDYFFDDHNRTSHEATAWVFAAGFDYDLCNNWTIGLSVKYQDWSASRHHRYRGSFGYDSYGEDFIKSNDDRIRDNHKWRSYAINLTFGRDF